jgi:hypothetical protein
MADIKSKIMKLLDISKDDAASEEEVENALAIAQKLMQRHHLSEEDLAREPEDQYAEIESAEKCEGFSWVGSKMHRWESTLGHAVESIVGGVKHYHRSKQEKTTPSGLTVRTEKGNAVEACSLAFYGLAEDVAIACRIYDEVREAIIALARIRHGSVFRGDGAAYAEGFTYGLYCKAVEANKAPRITQSSDSRALTLVARRQDLITRKGDAAKQWLSNVRGIKLRTGRTRKGTRTGSTSAYVQGKSDGERYSVDASRRSKLC